MIKGDKVTNQPDGNLPSSQSSSTSEPVIICEPVILRAARASDPTAALDKKMKSEAERLKSFEGCWPLDYISPRDLAQAGFYYIGPADRVKCPFCQSLVLDWRPNEQPYLEHKMICKKCPYLTGLDVGNIPIGPDPVKIWNSAEDEDTCGCSHAFKKAAVSKNTLSSAVVEPGKKYTPPKNTEFYNLGCRLRTFKDWPKDIPVQPEKLAEAGFYYIGSNLPGHRRDVVACYHCDICLNAWAEGDDPWFEHCRFSPDCDFVYLHKGQAFIDQCIAKCTESPSSNAQLQDTITSTTSSSAMEEVSPSVISEPADNQTATVETSTVTSEVNQQNEPALPQESSPTPSEIPSVTPEIPSVTPEKPVVSPENPIVLPEEKPHLSEDTEKPIKVDVGIQVIDPDESEISSLLETKIKLSRKRTKSSESSDEISVGSSSSSTSERTPSPDNSLYLCKICFEHGVGMAFIPCSHTVVCVNCGPNLSKCPFCRAPIERTFRLGLLA